MKRFVLLPFLTVLSSSWAYSQSLEEFQKHVTEFTLPNGFHFIVVERRSAPVVAFNSYVNVGSVDDPSGKTGLAHMFEHMAFKGTAQIGSRAWPIEKEQMAAIEKAYDALNAERAKGASADRDRVIQLGRRLDTEVEIGEKNLYPNLFTQIIEQNGGAGLNAQTGADSTEFFYKLPSNRAELWFLLESQRFFAPVFREFYKERSVVREERRMSVESNPEGLLEEAFLQKAFDVHPYRNTPGGSAHDIENFRLADAIAFYKKYYVPSNITMAIVGDIDPKEARRLAEKYFGIIPPGPPSPPVTIVEPVQVAEKRGSIQGESQPVEIIGYKRPPVTSRDDATLAVIGQVLAGGRTGIAYKELVTDKKVALSLGATALFPAGKYPNLFMIYFAPSLDRSLDDCEAPLFSIIDRLKTEKVDESTLRRVRATLRAELIDKLETNQTLAAELASAQGVYGDWRKLFTEIDEFERVTPDDVMRVAIEYLKPETRTVFRLTPAPDRAPKETGPKPVNQAGGSKP
jgi:predicted Zn-dependent peptidase